MKGIINQQEKDIAAFCVKAALKHGADQCRISLSKSIMDSFALLNGELDKVTHCADRSVYMYIYADSKYGTFSTNRLEEADLDRFIANAVDTVKMLAKDECRSLPEHSRTASDAGEGDELKLFDGHYSCVTAQDRLDAAMGASRYSLMKADEKGYCVISEECEYSDGIDDNYLIDSQGFEGRHIETSYSFCSEITISDEQGNKFSGYWWEASPKFETLNIESCSQTALEHALRQRDPKPSRSGMRKMVVDSSVATRLIAPMITALDSASIQQKNSFLEDCIGKKVFSEGLTVMDLARTPGQTGSRMYDTEGVATQDRAIIENGVVKMNFTSTYMANKMGIEPTCEGVSRPVLMPYGEATGVKQIISKVKNGIYVTGFNGGNCNPVTGDFSYGVEGFAFKDGKITHPVREMLITGNMVELWNNLLYAGTDSRSCTRWRVPSLAFQGVSFSA